MAKNYKDHICGECRNYVPRHSATDPEIELMKAIANLIRMVWLCFRASVKWWPVITSAKEEEHLWARGCVPAASASTTTLRPTDIFVRSSRNTWLLPDVRVSWQRTMTTIRSYPSVSGRSGMR